MAPFAPSGGRKDDEAGGGSHGERAHDEDRDDCVGTELPGIDRDRRSGKEGEGDQVRQKPAGPDGAAHRRGRDGLALEDGEAGEEDRRADRPSMGPSAPAPEEREESRGIRRKLSAVKSERRDEDFGTEQKRKD